MYFVSLSILLKTFQWICLFPCFYTKVKNFLEKRAIQFCKIWFLIYNFFLVRTLENKKVSQEYKSMYLFFLVEWILYRLSKWESESNFKNRFFLACSNYKKKNSLNLAHKFWIGLHLPSYQVWKYYYFFWWMNES
jgi:hypothetical protein